MFKKYSSILYDAIDALICSIWHDDDEPFCFRVYHSLIHLTV